MNFIHFHIEWCFQFSIIQLRLRCSTVQQINASLLFLYHSSCERLRSNVNFDFGVLIIIIVWKCMFSFLVLCVCLSRMKASFVANDLGCLSGIRQISIEKLDIIFLPKSSASMIYSAFNVKYWFWGVECFLSFDSLIIWFELYCQNKWLFVCLFVVFHTIFIRLLIP